MIVGNTDVLRRLALSAVVAVAVARCDLPKVERPTSEVPNLVGTTWQAVSVQGRSPVPGHAPTMEVRREGAAGNAGCNEWGSGPLIVSDGQIDMGNVEITQRACQDEAVARIEELFYEAVWQADSIALDGAALRLSGPGGEIVFERTR